MSSLDGLRRALLQLDGVPIALDARHAPQIIPIVNDLATGRDVSDQRLEALGRPATEAASRSTPSFIPVVGGNGKALAIIQMHGIALYNFDFPPYCFSTAKLAVSMRELADDSAVGKIVLDINTPGGHVTGTQEAADAVWNARKKKPVIGIVNPLCASAGYWIGSQCTKLIGVPSADIGSIGVFMCHADYSAMLAKAGIKPTFIYAGKHKTEGNSMEPLGNDAKSWFQSQVDQTYRDFLGTVARGRGTNRSNVAANFGGGRCLPSRTAIRAGMIDEVLTPDRALQSITAFKQTAAALAPRHLSAQARRRRIALWEQT